ncbi:VOC family protein [Streptomyces sp. NPDC056909]|uniref:VOC family protein n=1 Tax=unclassified Streptomyces TaxID=2593676 RepID=UPI0034250430
MTLENMIDHITLQVSDVRASRAFYERLLAPCGTQVVAEDGDTVGLGRGDKADIWIIPAEGRTDRELHVAFGADSRDHVDQVHRTAVEMGVAVLGEPALLPQYEPGYYACYVRDPDGHNIEVVARAT